MRREDPRENLPVTILQIIESLPLGGAENLLFVLARNADPKKFKFTFCCLKNGGKIAERLRKAGFEVVILGRRPARFPILILFDIARVIRKVRPEIVQTHLLEGNFWGRLAAAFTGNTMVFKTEHAILPRGFGEDSPAGRLRAWINHWLDRLSDKIIYVSETQRARLAADGCIPAHKQAVVPNGIDDEIFAPPPEASGGPPEETAPVPVVGSVGRLVPHKGHMKIVAAAAALKAEGLNLKLLFIGAGPEEGILRETAAAHGIPLEIVGGREDVPAQLRRMRVFVQPSEREAFGISLIEAMSQGVPVIGSDAGGIPEIIEHGKTGLIVPGGSPGGIKDAIRTILREPALGKRLGRAGIQAAAEKFSGRLYAERMLELYSASRSVRIRPSSRPPRIAYLLSSTAATTETFVRNEALALRRVGSPVQIFFLYGDRARGDREEWCGGAVVPPPLFSPPMLAAQLTVAARKPILYAYLLLRRKEFRGARVVWNSAFLARQAARLGIDHIHAHFAWGAADSARLIARLAGTTFSLTAHQSDINRAADANLADKLREAAFIFTCTRGNRDSLGRAFGPSVLKKTAAIYHGVDLREFNPSRRVADPGTDILSVGSLIKVKGFDRLVETIALLRAEGIPLRCRIIGEGPEREALEALIERRGLRGAVELAGRLPHARIADALADAKVFALAPVVIGGAPHGIPNVLVEAMAMGVPVAAFDVPDIGELLGDGDGGILCPPGDSRALAGAISRILKDRALGRELGERGRRRVAAEFDSLSNARKIARFYSKIKPRGSGSGGEEGLQTRGRPD